MIDPGGDVVQPFAQVGDEVGGRGVGPQLHLELRPFGRQHRTARMAELGDRDEDAMVRILREQEPVADPKLLDRVGALGCEADLRVARLDEARESRWRRPERAGIGVVAQRQPVAHAGEQRGLVLGDPREVPVRRVRAGQTQQDRQGRATRDPAPP